MLYLIYSNTVPEVHVLSEYKKMYVSAQACSHAHTLDFVIIDIFMCYNVEKLEKHCVKIYTIEQRIKTSCSIPPISCVPDEFYRTQQKPTPNHISCLLLHGPVY
jgi:hypothetical protein